MLSDAAIMWKKSGLLDYYRIGDSDEKIYFSDEQANELSKALEEAALHLTVLSGPSVITGVIFPIINRIYVGINKPGKFFMIVNIVDLFQDVEEKVNSLKLDIISDVLAEAEFCESYCAKYIEDLKKRGII